MTRRPTSSCAPSERARFAAQSPSSAGGPAEGPGARTHAGVPPDADLEGGETPPLLSPRMDARAARLEAFKGEQVIVDYLNRGVSIGEIAARLGFSEARMDAVVRDILGRRMPAPEVFAAIQASRLNEALLVAVSAMTDMNLRAVDRVIRIVRDLDRYHGFVAAGRRLPEPSRLAAPTDDAMTCGDALVGRLGPTAQEREAISCAPVLASDAARPPHAPRARVAPQRTGRSWLVERRRMPEDAPGGRRRVSSSRKPGFRAAARRVAGDAERRTFPSRGLGGRRSRARQMRRFRTVPKRPARP